VSPHETAKDKDLKAELVIIGGGGAGLAAAVAAAEDGASDVIVLEKRGVTGGNTSLSMGPFAADSPAQKRAAIEFRRDELFKIAMNWAHWKTNPRIVRAFIDKSGDTIRWLEDKGIEFRCMPLYPNQSPLVWHMPKGYGAEIIKVLAGECRKLGITLLTNTPARKLMTGRKGNITGILAEREGKELKITARSVIIATGGYSGNKELLRKYCPDYRDNMKCDGVLHTGDGLIMAMEIGAATEGLGLLLLSGPQIPQSVALKIGSPADKIPEPLMAIALEPNTLWVNKKGKRFIDEGTSYHHFECSNAVNRQPGNLCYTLLDSRLVQTMTETGLIIGLGRHTVAERDSMPGLARELRSKEAPGWVKIADDCWDGIADWIGADREVLKATIEEYNAACDRGHDPVFAKERALLVPLRTPPYYAIRSNSDFLDTIGGIKINENMEVLDRQDNPIPGLYAAGVATGGWQAETYCDVLSGSASGFAFNSGRIAAENAVKFITGR
jgi:fumarate reductase flavoprotein subunit